MKSSISVSSRIRWLVQNSSEKPTDRRFARPYSMAVINELVLKVMLASRLGNPNSRSSSGSGGCM